MAAFSTNTIKQRGAMLLAGVLLAACSSLSVDARIEKASTMASQAGWQEHILKTSAFDLRAYTNNKKPINRELTVYIEGDGYAWVDGQFPSNDPTPLTPIALQLALKQPSGAVAYLARPCQYIGAGTNAACTKSVWSDARFSQQVVTATSDGIDQLKAQTGATKITLVGYSGGAAVALLVAAQRSDITQIITVAGNLDPHAWSKQLKLQPLTGSLDPATAINKTSHMPQVDFVGGKDRVVPAALTENFAKQYPANQRPRIINEPDFGHVCCWAEQWPQLWIQATTQ